MARPFNFAEGEFYHIYNRGVDKREIFATDADYRRFIALLFLSNSDRAVDLEEIGPHVKAIMHIDRGDNLISIGAYCLMPNHFHLLVQESTHGGVSKFMQKLTTGYTMYFNRLNERTGSLFQGTFKAEHAAEDRYLKYLFAYIHLNPAKLVNPEWREKGIRGSDIRYVESYQYSSYQDYLMRKREENAIISRKEFPEYFNDPKEFRNEMREWLNFAKREP